MSAGAFLLTRYESDQGTIHEIKVQPETVAATFDGTANAATTDDVDSVFAAEVSRGARAYGLRPRKVRVKFGATPPDGYQPFTTISLPILQQSVFDAIAPDDPVVYAGATGTAGRKIAESILPGTAALTVTAP